MDSSTEEVNALVHLLQRVEQALRVAQPPSISPKTGEALIDKLEDVTVRLERALAEVAVRVSETTARVVEVGDAIRALGGSGALPVVPDE